MRYLTLVKATAHSEAGEAPSARLQELMGDYIGKAIADGIFVDGGGLLPSRHGTRYSLEDGSIASVPGPFDLGAGLVSGYAIIEVPDDAAAQDVARDFIDVHIKGGVKHIDIEIRPIESM